jgi:hypothetical protein
MENGGIEEKGKLKGSLRDKYFWKIGVAEAIRMMITVAVVTHVMPYLSSIGMSRFSAAFVAMSIPLLSIIGRFGLDWLSDIFDKNSQFPS